MDRGFFDSLDGDRLYNAGDFRKFANVLVNTGLSVTTSNADSFKVTAESPPSMNLNISEGSAVILGGWINTDQEESVSIPTASTTYTRYDAVVLEFNATNNVRDFVFKVIQGTPSSSPVHPSLIQNDEVFQVALAWIRVAPNITSIDSARIIDARGTDDCPWMSTAEVENMKQTWRATTSKLGGVVVGAGLGFDAQGRLKVLGGEGGYGTFDYNELVNHPTVNGVELIGDLHSSDLELPFDDADTVFNQDGSITTTYTNCSVVTIFNNDGSITEQLRDSDNVTIKTKTTTFNQDGSITETVS